MERGELTEREKELRSELRKIETALAKPSQATIDKELPRLRRLFWAIAVGLATALVASLLSLHHLLSAEAAVCRDPYALAAIAGFGGSAVSALLSVNSRYAAGLEFSDGTSYPSQERKERFNARLAPGFIFRPLLGALTGALLVVALRAGIFGATKSPSLPELLVWSVLGGLFAKALLEKLKDVFANLVGRGAKAGDG